MKKLCAADYGSDARKNLGENKVYKKVRLGQNHRVLCVRCNKNLTFNAQKTCTPCLDQLFPEQKCKRFT